jgi:hypothetical protein
MPRKDPGNWVLRVRLRHWPERSACTDNYGPHTMTINSAGILMYRRSDDGIEVLLGHPGGPF